MRYTNLCLLTYFTSLVVVALVLVVPVIFVLFSEF